MLSKLLRGLRDAAPQSAGVNRELATAVLLLEVARSDFKDQPGELQAVREALATEFGFEPGALERLVTDAQRESGAAVSMHDYVQALNRELQPEDKLGLIRRLWSVAHADGKVDPLEEHTLRRLADLLHVPHADFIRAKLTTR